MQVEEASTKVMGLTGGEIKNHRVKTYQEDNLPLNGERESLNCTARRLHDTKSKGFELARTTSSLERSANAWDQFSASSSSSRVSSLSERVSRSICRDNEKPPPMVFEEENDGHNGKNVEMDQTAQFTEIFFPCEKQVLSLISRTRK